MSRHITIPGRDAGRLRAASLLLSLVVLVAACGNDDPGTTTTTVPTPDVPTTTAPPVETTVPETTTTTPPDAGAEIPDTPAGVEVRWVLDQLAATEGPTADEAEDRFAESFLAEVPPDSIAATFDQIRTRDRSP